MSEYPLCTLLVEEGRAATPVRERCKINPVYGSSTRASFSGHYQVPKDLMVILTRWSILEYPRLRAHSFYSFPVGPFINAQYVVTDCGG